MMKRKAAKTGNDLQAPAVAPATRGAIRRRLADWYASAKRDLPWRRTRDPYAIWVSEVMLQQTQVKTVLPYYAQFLKRFPDIMSLAGAHRQTVLKAWEGLGYYSRARNMHRAARIVAEQMNGRLPSVWEDLRQLPGIGDYIAAAVLSIAHDAPYAVVDGNVKRVLARLFCVEQPINVARMYRAYQGLADQLLDRSRSGDHNQAVMELGALVCTPRNPDCGVCPLAGFCCAHKSDRVRAYPKRRPRSALPTRVWLVGAVMKNDRFLFTRRPDNGLLGGLWEFPGREIEPGGDGAANCRAIIRSLLHLNVAVDGKVATITHTFTHFKLRMELYLCRWKNGKVRRKGPAAHRWLRTDQAGSLPLHGAMHKAMARIDELLSFSQSPEKG